MWYLGSVDSVSLVAQGAKSVDSCLVFPELQSTEKLLGSSNAGNGLLPLGTCLGKRSDKLMSNEDRRISLTEFSKKPWGERVQFLLKNLESLGPAMKQFHDVAWKTSGAEDSIFRKDFEIQHADAFSIESVCRLLATRFSQKANSEQTPENELPVDTFQIVAGRAIVNGKALSLDSSFAEYDSWLGQKRKNGGLSRLAELALVRACEDGCAPDRNHSRSIAFQWFYEYFGQQVEQRLKRKYSNILNEQQIEDAVAKAMLEFYRTYLPANDSPELHKKRVPNSDKETKDRSRWAGRMFLFNFLMTIALRRLPKLYFVLTQQSLNLLRDFPDSVILKLREISGVTYKTAQEIISIATDPDSVLTEEQLNVLRNAFTRTTDKNPRFINRPPTPSELCEIDKLIRSIIHNHVPERGTFTELPLTGQEIIKVGRRLEDCIKMTRTNCEETPYKFSTCGVLINGIGFEELTNDEQVRLIDYLYLQQPTNVDDATPSAQHYSRVDGWTKLRLRKCFSALLGIDLLNRAAETLRTHIDAGTLPPGGLLALLFTEEDAKQIWNREEFLSSLAFDYHYCGYPMRRLMTLKRKKHYQKRLDQLQQDQHVVAPDLLNQDLQNHWKETCSVVNEAFLSIGKQICRKEA